jgi:S-methylmethionine-dependent homocysteine/selenocysteine methylase
LNFLARICEHRARMRYRGQLPQLDGRLFMTDGGIETTLIFEGGFELPEFAAVDLLRSEDGTEALRSYYTRYAELAAELGIGFVLESPTWRASPAWAARLGYSSSELDQLNRAAIALMEEIRGRYEAPHAPFVISGCIGPQGDGYAPETMLSADDAAAYHSTQIATFADTSADMVTAVTMTYAAEAVGIVRAASREGLPAAISFTVETDGRLPSGQALGAAIDQVDEETHRAAAYFMINCAHPTHFEHVLKPDSRWTARVRGVRANASTKSHAELDEATTLDAGDPADLATCHDRLRPSLPNLNIVGGCCGTDHRHVAAICHTLLG